MNDSPPFEGPKRVQRVKRAMHLTTVFLTTPFCLNRTKRSRGWCDQVGVIKQTLKPLPFDWLTKPPFLPSKFLDHNEFLLSQFSIRFPNDSFLLTIERRGLEVGIS